MRSPRRSSCSSNTIPSHRFGRDSPDVAPPEQVAHARARLADALHSSAGHSSRGSRWRGAPSRAMLRARDHPRRHRDRRTRTRRATREDSPPRRAALRPPVTAMPSRTASAHVADPLLKSMLLLTGSETSCFEVLHGWCQRRRRAGCVRELRGQARRTSNSRAGGYAHRASHGQRDRERAPQDASGYAARATPLMERNTTQGPELHPSLTSRQGGGAHTDGRERPGHRVVGPRAQHHDVRALPLQRARRCPRACTARHQSLSRAHGACARAQRARAPEREHGLDPLGPSPVAPLDAVELQRREPVRRALEHVAREADRQDAR